MKAFHYVAPLLIGGLVLVGCREEQTPTAPDAPTGTNQTAPTDRAAEVDDQVRAEGEALISKIKGLIEENKVQEAIGELPKLEGLLDKLPEDLRAQAQELVKTVREKAASGLQNLIPGQN